MADHGVVLGVLAVGAILAVGAAGSSTGLDVQAYLAYEEAHLIPARKSADIARLRQLYQQAGAAGDTALLGTIAQYLTNLGVSSKASQTPHTSTTSAPKPTPTVTHTTTSACGATTLQRGSTGACVVLVQKDLNALAGVLFTKTGNPVLTPISNGGHATALTLDGIYGPRTQAVVREFQIAVGVPVTGTVGPTTWKALAATLAAVLKASQPTATTPASGAAVAIVSGLGITAIVSGIVRSSTRIATAASQDLPALEQDAAETVSAVVDTPTTWEELAVALGIAL